MVPRQVGEHAAGLLMGEQSEDDALVLTRQSDNHVGDVGRVHAHERVSKLVPLVLMRQTREVGSDFGCHHRHRPSPDVARRTPPNVLVRLTRIVQSPAPARKAFWMIACASSWIRRRWSLPLKLSA